MVESKEHIDKPERSGGAGSEEYEVRHFAEAIGLDVEKVRALIQRHGESRTIPKSKEPKPGSH